jgi:hypothetical protein
MTENITDGSEVNHDGGAMRALSFGVKPRW